MVKIVLLLLLSAKAFAETVEMVEQHAYLSLSAPQPSSTIVAAIITGLSLPVAQGATFSFRVDLYVSMSSPATGILIGMTSSAASQAYVSTLGCQADGTNQSGASITSPSITSTVSLNGGTTSAHCVITGTITGSESAASTLIPTVARSSSVGTVTVLTGSTIKAERIN